MSGPVAPDRRSDRIVLAVDLGTGGPKVGLVALDGTVVWSDHVAVHTDYGDDGSSGSATQDAEQWWAIVCDATRRGLAESGVDGRQVVGVGVTGQWASTVPVDAGGTAVGPCLMWMDTRGAPYSTRALAGPVHGYRPRVLATWLRRNGGIPSLTGDDPIGHMLYLQHRGPRTARWFLEPVDYLSMRFTGRPAASAASMMGAWLTDNRDLAAPGYDDTLVRLVGIDSTKLPPLVPTGSIIGPVLPGVAADLGISSQAQVVTGTPDLHSATIGSGAVRPHDLHMTISTTSWISCPMSRKKTDVLHQMATVPGISPSSYLLVNNQDTAGRSLQWLRDNVFGVSGMFGLFGPAGSDAASSQADHPGVGYQALTALAGTAPPGSHGVIFTPWLKGERSPIDDRNARGGFHNLSLSTTRADLVRAVLEGVAYNSRWLLGHVDAFAGTDGTGPIRIIGGGAQADLWCQIIADVCDRPCERVADPLNAQLRGAALFAGLGMGQIGRGELRDLVPVDTVFRPTPANRAVYHRLFAEFPGLYRAQKAMFARLNRHSGR